MDPLASQVRSSKSRVKSSHENGGVEASASPPRRIAARIRAISSSIPKGLVT
jgi:hypothetical protein